MGPTSGEMTATPHEAEIVLDAHGIVRTYRRGEIEVPVLKGLDLQVARGEWVACTGRSGSGKSTLLNVLGLLDSADDGTYLLAGHDVSELDDTGRARLRNLLLGLRLPAPQPAAAHHRARERRHAARLPGRAALGAPAAGERGARDGRPGRPRRPRPQRALRRPDAARRHRTRPGRRPRGPAGRRTDRQPRPPGDR